MTAAPRGADRDSVAFIAAVAKGCRRTDDPRGIMHATAEAVAHRFGAQCVGFFLAPSDTTSDESAHWSDGRQRPAPDAFYADLFSNLTRDASAPIKAVFPGDRWAGSENAAAQLLDLGVRAFVGLPLVRHGLLRAGFYIVHAKDHAWTPADVALAEIVAELAWDAIESARLEKDARETTSLRAATWRVSPHLLAVVDMEGRFLRINPTWTKLLGWSEDEVNGRHFSDFMHPDDLARTYAQHEEVHEGKAALNFENRYRAKDGSYHWLSWVSVPDHGKIYASARDITAEKEVAANLRRTEDALRHSQKMEAVGQLTGGLAHDFNNMLGVMLGNLELLQDRLAEDAGSLRLITRIEQSAQRSAELIQRLLTFARQKPMNPHSTDVGLLVANLEQMLAQTIGKEVTLRVDQPTNLWHAVVDTAQLETAILNLVINAKDAMPNGGSLTVGLANLTCGTSPSAAADVSPGDYVVISVSDTGQGMSLETRNRAFEPFYTTKEFGKGTGLGLSMVFGFMKQSKGHVELESEVGKGTTVKLFLPRGLPVRRPSSDLQRGPKSAGSESILVVEDNELMRDTTVNHLKSLGYRITAVASGKDALDVLEQPNDIDLLFTDVVMPGGITGPELAKTALQQWPELKVIFVSGYTANQLFGPDWEASEKNLLQKPFRKSELAAMLGKVLGHPEAVR